MTHPKQGTKNIPILMYHCISQSTASTDSRFKAYCVPPALFAAQVDYLYHNGYTLLNATQLIHTLTGKAPLPERPVVLTFDDGYADFYYHALPLLSRYRLTATLYIVTGFVGKTSLWAWKRETGHPVLTWDQIAEISHNGIECGAHTQSHANLAAIPQPMARNEIRLSKDILEQHLGLEVTSFAYPHGSYTSAIRRLVKEAGFTSACAGNHAMCSDQADHFLLERLMVTPSMDMSAFHDLLTQERYSRLRKMYIRARIPAKHTIRCFMASASRLYRNI